MQHFPAPSPNLKFDRMNEDTLFRSKNLFDSFFFHSIHLLIPSSNAYKEKYEDMLASDENVYFTVKDVTAKCLIEKSFLENFVKAGSLLALSQNARVEVENFLTIISPGKLVLSLEKSIAQCLALQKENPNKKKRKKHFDSIIIDIRCPEFSPGKKIYEFVSFELSKIEHIKFTLLLKWKPEGNVCPQSIKSYFVSQGYECIACKPNLKYSSKFSVPAPIIRFELHNAPVLQDVMEWVGMQICGIEYSNEENEYASKLFVPESSETLNKLHTCSFEGFYSKREILPLMKEIRKIFQMDSTMPFIVLCLSGFQDSFIVANGFQHFSSDDKLIYAIAFPSGNYWLITLNAA